jgi:endo-1,3-1,4-beta-glycanase ExoK
VGKQLTFDPSADFHTYRFDYDPGVVRFYVDGALQKTWTDGAPDASMKLFLNTWFPNWLEGPAPLTSRVTRVDWISYQQQ